jgi:hypothetical protein
MHRDNSNPQPIHYLAMKVEASAGAQPELMPFFKPLSWR